MKLKSTAEMNDSIKSNMMYFCFLFLDSFSLGSGRVLNTVVQQVVVVHLTPRLRAKLNSCCLRQRERESIKQRTKQIIQIYLLLLSKGIG